jgi:uncharacterized protein
MLLLDTSVWIEWFMRSALGEEVDRRLPVHDADVVMPTIVQLELAKWFLREANVDAAAGVVAFTRDMLIVPLSTDLALEASHRHRAHKLATADAVIYATARSLAVPLLTCDAHFQGLDGVEWLEKPAG